MILEIKDLHVTYNSKSDNPNAAVRLFMQTCRSELKKLRSAEQAGCLPE